MTSPEGGESLKPKPYPISENAARRGFRRAFGGRTTNQEQYERYGRQTERNQPHLVASFPDTIAGKQRILGDALLGNGYIGGVISFLASAEEQVKLNRLPSLPRISKTAIRDGFVSDVQRGGGLLLLPQVINIFQTELPPDVLSDARGRSFEEFSAAINEYEADALVFSRRAEANVDLINKYGACVQNGVQSRLDEFAQTEHQFVEFMQMWWEDADPLIHDSHLLGAADMKQLLEIQLALDSQR